MRLWPLLGLTAIAVLGGCATPADEAYTPAGMSWSFDLVDGQWPTLAYGKDETDDVPVIMTCAPNRRRIELNVAVGAPPPERKISLESGGAVSSLEARYEEDALGPGVVAHTTADDPALRRFGDTGQFIVHVGKERISLPSPDPTPVRKFLASCAG